MDRPARELIKLPGKSETTCWVCSEKGGTRKPTRKGKGPGLCLPDVTKDVTSSVSRSISVTNHSLINGVNSKINSVNREKC